MEKLTTIRMGINETFDSYWGRMSDILLRMGAYQIPDNFLRNVFERGLYLFKSKLYVRECTLATSEDAFALAKSWEESHVEHRYMFDNYNYNLYDQPKNHQSHHPVLPGQSLTYPCAKPMIDATQFKHPSVDLFAPPKVILKPTPITQSSPQELALMDITKKLADLEVKITKGASKQPQPIEERTNIWWNNCKGHGHLSNECPTPKGIRIKCTFCGGNPSVNECWNLTKSHAINKLRPINHDLGNKNVLMEGLMQVIIPRRILIIDQCLSILGILDLVGVILINHPIGMVHHIIP